MSFFSRKNLLFFTVIQIIIIILSEIFYNKISLICYINISFCVSSALLLSSLFLYTIQSGFFDVFAKSFNMFSTKRKWEEIPSLSELVSLKQKPLLQHGLGTLIFMLGALFAYYF